MRYEAKHAILATHFVGNSYKMRYEAKQAILATHFVGISYKMRCMTKLAAPATHFVGIFTKLTVNNMIFEKRACNYISSMTADRNDACDVLRSLDVKYLT